LKKEHDSRPFRPSCPVFLSSYRLSSRRLFQLPLSKVPYLDPSSSWIPEVVSRERPGIVPLNCRQSQQ
jgi:hypothetical protein